MTTPRPRRTRRERWLRAGVVVGALLVIVPFGFSLLSIGRVSGVPEGFRGATHHPELQRGVGIALGSTMALALLAPLGVLLLVLSGVSLAEEKRRRDGESRARGDAPKR